MKLTRSLLFAVTLFAINGCAHSPEQTEVSSAASAYLKANGTIDSPKIAVEKVDGNYARVLATPLHGETDPAFIFLKKSNGAWRGLTLGTGFSPDDYQALGIPAAVQLR